MNNKIHGITGNGKEFAINVWAPYIRSMELQLDDKKIKLNKDDYGYFSGNFNYHYYGLYNLIADGRIIPDPAGHFMPGGINGKSQIIPDSYEFKNRKWNSHGIKDSIIEEIHIGTFTENGDYKSVEKHIDYLNDTGINTVEIMPLAQAYGSRNWGYDGVFLYSPAYSYGTPEELKHMIDSFHEYDINVILDVVYNHSGPLGNILNFLGPYYSENYINPWGKPFNYDGAFSDSVRSFVLQNAAYWIEKYNFDGLRLDAIHSIYDSSPVNIIKEIAIEISKLEIKLGRKIKIIAESDKNDSSIVKSRKTGGYGLSAHWNDDFHHAIYTYLSGEDSGYYMDYGEFNYIVDSLRHGYVYNHKYSNYLKKTRGTEFINIPKSRLIVFNSNHDQIGNRAFGERPVKLLGEQKNKLFIALTLLSPFTPMLFQGEEYGEESPFLFFVDPPDKEFANSILNGRRSEFKDFPWGDEIPDPSDIETFMHSKLKWNKSLTYINYYKELIKLRKLYVTDNYKVDAFKKIIKIIYDRASIYFSFMDSNFTIPEKTVIFNSSGINNNLLVPYGVAIVK